MEENPKVSSLDALLGLGGAGLDTYLIARARFFRNVGVGFLLVIFQCMLNYWGYQSVNIAIFFVLFGLSMYAISHPAVLAALAALKAWQNEKADNPSAQKSKDINYFALYSGYLFLWLSIISMFTVTLPLGWYLSFEEALGVTFVALIFISVIGWAALNKWITTSIYKKLITRYAIIGCLICAWMLIPGSLKFAVTGLDFYGPLGTSETAKAMSKSAHKIAVAKDKKDAKRILAIGQDKAAGGNISADDQAFWKEAQEKLQKESIPGRISGMISGIDLSWLDFASGKNPPPPPPPTPAQSQPQPVPQYQPPVRMALLPGEQVAPPPPSPPVQQEFVVPNGLWTVQLLNNQQNWAQWFPEGRILLDGRWTDGKYILRIQGDWRKPIVAEMQPDGPKRLRGYWDPYWPPGQGEIRIEFLDARSGRGMVSWGNQENGFQIRML